VLDGGIYDASLGAAEVDPLDAISFAHYRWG
jgi:hypothetical protein